MDDGSVTSVEREPEKKPEGGFVRRFLHNLAYPLNHALSCLFTDTVISTPIAAGVETIGENSNWAWLKKLWKRTSHSHVEDSLGKTFSHNLKHWFQGEVIGDLSAAGLTTAIRSLSPQLMNGMRKAFEPLFGWYFKKGSEREAKTWAITHNLDPNGPEAKAKREKLYEYEVGHLGDIFL